jgi:hypothetical protein
MKPNDTHGVPVPAAQTTPQEDAALLWLGTVRDDFRRMADEANRLLSDHARNIASGVGTPDGGRDVAQG